MPKKRTKKTVTEAEKKIKSQKEEQNKILKSILIIIVFIAVGFFLFIIVSKSLSSFDYRGVEFTTVKFCDAGPPCLVTYQTSLPVKVDGKDIYLTLPSKKTNDYNFYIRNDPRKIEVDFYGVLDFRDVMVLNSEADFICEGKGAIAGANLNQLYKILKISVIRDENTTCDSNLGRYMFVNVRPGNETSVEQIGSACYNININNCEILEGTERFMVETFVEVNKALKEQE